MLSGNQSLEPYGVGYRIVGLITSLRRFKAIKKGREYKYYERVFLDSMYKTNQAGKAVSRYPISKAGKGPFKIYTLLRH